MPTRRSPTAPSGPDAVALLGFAGLVLMAGSNVVAVRFSNRELEPFWGAGLRFFLAAALMFAALRLLRLPLPRGRALLGGVVYGLLSFGAFFAFAYWGLLRVPAGLASLLLASVPLLTFLLAWLHGVERFRWRGLAGALVALTGIGVIFFAPVQGDVPVASMLAILAAAACGAEASVLLKIFPGTHPITTNAVGMAAGAAVLLALSAAAGEAWRLPTTASVRIALVYLVLFGSFTLFILFVFVLDRWTASGISYLFVLMPVVAVALSAWLEGEPLTLALFAGGALVLFGVWIGTLSGRRGRSARHRADAPVEG